MPHSLGPYKKKPRTTLQSVSRAVAPVAIATLVVSGGLFSLPTILSMDIKAEKISTRSPFPISVNPARKLMVENTEVDALIEDHASGALSAAVADVGSRFFPWLASEIAALPLYRQLAGADIDFVVIQPGYRQEQVAQEFGKALGWSAKERQDFLRAVKSSPPTLSEGEFSPGTYEVYGAMTPADVQIMVSERFTDEILNRYSTTTAEQVPLSDALTIASLIERETGGTDDIRLISGIIWNRLFKGMNLQIDATLQYAKADTAKSWWPVVKPADKYIKSAYNTYAYPGLPPGPIASPSVAAVIAALNPKPTDCVFYFHDRMGNFHCAATYEEHVRLLKKYYGQGK